MHALTSPSLPLSAAALLLGLGAALASGPVPRTMTGCVANGAFTSQDGYRIAVMGSNNRPANLAGYNGKRISVSGDLLPGDHFYPKSAIRVLGPCR